MRNCYRAREKSSSAAASNRFGREVMVALAIDVRVVCYYKVLTKNITMNAACYLEFLKRLMDHWHAS